MGFRNLPCVLYFVHSRCVLLLMMFFVIAEFPLLQCLENDIASRNISPFKLNDLAT